MASNKSPPTPGLASGRRCPFCRGDKRSGSAGAGRELTGYDPRRRPCCPGFSAPQDASGRSIRRCSPWPRDQPRVRALRPGSHHARPWLGRQADRRGRRDIAILAALPIIVFAAVYWLEAPRPILYAASIAAGAGITGVSASWYALLSDATDGGRHGRRFGTVAALGNLGNLGNVGINLGATLTAQLRESFDEVGVGFVIAGVSVAICVAAFTLYPSDDRLRPE
jgi:hypothetical protein